MADKNEDAAGRLHIVVFPWLAFGHMLPFLELSKSLGHRGHCISFISTPRNIQRLPKLPHELAHLIDLLAFDLPKVEGLRESAEATVDLPPEEVPYLKWACDGLEQPFRHFIKHLHPTPDWILHDFIQHWMPSAAAELGIPCIFYCTISAAAQACHGRLWDTSSPRPLTLDAFLLPPPWVAFPSNVAYRRHELLKLQQMIRFPNPSGVPELHRLKSTMEGSSAFVVRSCRELESEYLRVMGDVYKKPIIPVGLLPPQQVSEDAGTIMKWLDEQRSRSVIYVALGSETAISVEQIQELALGLEAARVPFVWGLRRPFGIGEDVEMLPEGFEDRTEGVGMVIMGWVPQVKILAHGSVGGFLTHCGWSSIIEGLQAGRPLVMLPLAIDQGLNARLMEEKGVGLEVERKEDGCFSRGQVCKAVRMVMAEKEGEAFRDKARDVKEMVADTERQNKYVDEFAEYLATHRTTT